MPRIKVTIPEEAIHLYKSNIPVLISHINYGKHLGNDSLISILHEARLRFIKSIGIQDEVCIDDNVSLVVASLAVTYSKEVLHGDYLDVDIFVSDITKTTCDFYYKVTRITNNVSIVIALASMCLLFIDFQSRKPIAIPHNLYSAITNRKP